MSNRWGNSHTLQRSCLLCLQDGYDGFPCFAPRTGDISRVEGNVGNFAKPRPELAALNCYSYGTFEGRYGFTAVQPVGRLERLGD